MPKVMNVQIYQLTDDPAAHSLFFRSYSSLERSGDVVKAENYELRYDCWRPDSDNLEAIYAEFNIDRPEDFKGHSLSVSDVLVINRDGTPKCYYVDSIGFKEIPDFNPECAYKPTSL